MRSTSIQTKTFLLYLSAIVLSSLLVGAAAYGVALSSLQSRVQRSYQANTEFAAQSVEQELQRIEQLTNYLYVNTQVKDFLSTPPTATYAYLKQQETIEFMLNSFALSTSHGAYNLIQLYSEGSLRLSFAPSSLSRYYDIDRVAASTLLATRTFSVSCNPGDLYYDYYKPAPFVSVFRQIPDHSYSGNLGQMFISISPAIFSKISESYNQETGSLFYILDQTGAIVNPVSSQSAQLVTTLYQNQPQQATQIRQDGHLFFYQPLSKYGWSVVSAIPISALTPDSSTIILVILLAFATSILLSLLVWRFTAVRIYHPLKELTQAVRLVELGDLTITAPVRCNDEIGELSHHFNNMLKRITELIERVVNEQSQLKDAQYQALQAQINPHFLYNTLNSIRWMAMMLRAENIKTMIDALVRLLRSSARKGDFSTLREEIQSVEDYIFIQRVATSYKFEVEWSLDETLLHCTCPSFILQPIVENAVFHGIVPKDGDGVLRLSLYSCRWNELDCLAFVIEDDGVGMSQQQLESFCSRKESGQLRFSGIGIRNVDERLRLTYGDAYGLVYESEQNSYTRVSIHIPHTTQTGVEP